MHDSLKLLSDQKLSALLKEGNIFAYQEIYCRYAERLYVHAYKRLQNKEDCRDIIQNLFVMLWEKRDSLIISDNLSNYLYTSVRNAVFNFLAKKKISCQHLTSIYHFSLGYHSNTDHVTREKQLQEIIDKEIELLPKRTKEIFKLSRQEHFSHKQIAEKLNLSEQTVKTTVNNALKILRIKLGSFLFYFF